MLIMFSLAEFITQLNNFYIKNVTTDIFCCGNLESTFKEYTHIEFYYTFEYC